MSARSDQTAGDTQPVHPAALSALGAWNFYFLAKLALAWTGHLNFHVLPNIVFAAALLLPWRWGSKRVESWIGRARLAVAVPVAVALLVHDTWYPPLDRLLQQRTAVLQFTPDFLIELVGRFVNWHLLGALFVLVVILWLLSQWLRLTTFTLLGLGWMVVSAAVSESALQPPANTPATTGTVAGVSRDSAALSHGPATDAKLDNQLQEFYATESRLRANFKPIPAGAAPFDVLILQICSMDWDDLSIAGLQDNALFRRMDVTFDNFNSATSYSGPAGIRLLRASCGQTNNAALYQAAPPHCVLFDNLRQLGFLPQMQLNNDDDFDHYLDEMRAQGLPALTIPERDFKFQPTMSTFTGHPLWNDEQVLEAWWKRRLAQPAPRVALFYDTISLHDGNRYLLPGGGSRLADYRSRAQTLIGDLNAFIDTLEHSDRKVLLIIDAEHGDNLRGDRMQIPGMRDIPSPTITHVPAAVKLIGFGGRDGATTLHVTAPSSYLALSELVARLAAQPTLDRTKGFDWQTALAGLPQTRTWVAANGEVVVMKYDGAPYVRLKEQGSWQKYPQ